MPRRFAPGHPCCSYTVGFETMQYPNSMPESHLVRPFPIQSCVPWFNWNIIDVDENTDLKTFRKCHLLLLGAGWCKAKGTDEGKSTEETAYTRTDPQAVRDYLGYGGRIVVVGEWSHTFGGGCSDNSKTNEWLKAVGLSMRVTGDKCCNNSGVGWGDNERVWGGEINDMPLTDDIDVLYHGATNEVQGGTWIAKTEVISYVDAEGHQVTTGISRNYDDSYNKEQFPDEMAAMEEKCRTPITWIAIQQTGAYRQGCAVVTGDSNFFTPNIGDNCRMIRKLAEFPIENILPR